MGRPNILARELGEPTYIDLSIIMWGGGTYDWISSHRKDALKPTVPAQQEIIRGMWECRDRRISEGGVLFAMLYLDTKFRSTNKRLLDSTFLSLKDPGIVEDSRYPSLYLDGKFMSSDVLRSSHAVHVIRNNVRRVPSTLLCQLAINLMHAPKATNPTSITYNTLQETAYLLIVCLGESDRPALAK